MTTKSLFKALPIIVSIVVLFWSSNLAQTFSSIDSSTPAGLALGGSGSGGTDFGSISPFNGALNYTIPLLQVGGRGQAGYTISLPNNARWVMTHTVGSQEETWNSPGSGIGGPIESRYMPGVVYGRKNSSGSNCGPSEPVSYSTQTRLTFVMADGSEVDLVSLTKGGGQLIAYCGGSVESRGTVFVSEDGSGMKFVSDTEIFDGGFGPVTFAPSGLLHFRDGITYRIDNGRVSRISDRNGNKTTFTYDGN